MRSAVKRKPAAPAKKTAAATLTISSKNYSSWSLRGWLLVTMAGLPFKEEVRPVDDPSTFFIPRVTWTFTSAVPPLSMSHTVWLPSLSRGPSIDAPAAMRCDPTFGAFGSSPSR